MPCNLSEQFSLPSCSQTNSTYYLFPVMDWSICHWVNDPRNSIGDVISEPLLTSFEQTKACTLQHPAIPLSLFLVGTHWHGLVTSRTRWNRRRANWNKMSRSSTRNYLTMRHSLKTSWTICRCVDIGGKSLV